MSVFCNSMLQEGTPIASSLLPTALAWYDASDDSYLNLSGNEIIQFLDRTGKGNNTDSQGTSTARMTRTTNQQNSLATAIADGTDYYTLPSALYGLSNDNNTIFVVGNCTSETIARYFLAMTGAAVSTRYFLRSETTSGQVSFTNSAASTNRATVTVTKSNYNIFTTRFAISNQQRMMANNGNFSSNPSGAKGVSIAMTLGTYTSLTGYLIGGIAEVIMFNRALSGNEIIAVNKYLSTKWGITLT